MPDFSLPKQQRLRRKSSIDELFANGRHGYAYPFKYCFLSRNQFEQTAILVSVPKKMHKRAVKRNLLRRRTKESYRQSKYRLTDVLASKGLSAHIALIYSTKYVSDYKTIDHAVQKILGEIAARS